MRQLLRRTCLLLVVSCALVGVTAEGVTAQSAGDGLEERSVNSFAYDPDRGVVRVTVDVDLRNVTTDQVDGNVVRRTFFDTYAIAVPLGAENIVALGDGTVLEGTLVADPDFPAFSTYRIGLDSPLFSGDATTLQVTYDHLGAPPRDPVPWRVNEAYAGFVAFGLGDDGLVTLRISRPFGFEFDEFTDLSEFEIDIPDGFGTSVYTRSGLDGGTTITVGMSDDTRLVPRDLDVEGVDIELRSWPDDPEWADFASGRVEAGIPALEALIGTAWPVDGSFAVRETVEPALYGYAGWFDAQSSEIAVGEALNADTIYHELSHAWFNRGLSTERWLTEGLAQVYAAELVGRDGGVPRASAEPDREDPNAGPLTEWTGFGSERAVEEYGYDASFWVLDVIVDEIGFDRAREVVDTLRAGTSPYDAETSGERPDEDWQRAYDAFVEVGGASTAGDLFRSFVVGPAGVDLLEQRDLAASEVNGLVGRGEPWSLPVGIRQQLEAWELDAVGASVVAADEVLERRTRLEAIEDSVGIDEPDRAGEAYASAPRPPAGAVEFDDVRTTLDESIALGDDLVDRQEDIATLTAAAGVTPPDVGSLDDVEDFATGLAAAEAQLLALDGIIELDERLDGASGLLVTVGRWGSDLEGDLDDARAELERGDSAAALATLGAVDRRLDDLAATGTLRLSIAGAAAVALALSAIAIHRRRRQRGAV